MSPAQPSHYENSFALPPLILSTDSELCAYHLFLQSNYTYTVQLFIIENLEWDSFEDIEPYIKGDHGSLLRNLVPGRIWWALFSPTSRDRETLSDNRKKTSAEYESVTSVSYEVQSNLQGRDVQIENGDSDGLANEMDYLRIQSRFPVSVGLSNKYNTIERYLADVDDALSCERETVSQCKDLLSRPKSAFLRTNERSEIREVLGILSKSIGEGEQIWSRIELIRKDTVEIIDDRIPAWQQNLRELEDRSHPYTSLDKFLSDKKLILALETLREEVVVALKKNPVPLTSRSGAGQLREIKKRTDTLIHELKESQWRFAELDRFAKSQTEQLEERCVTALSEFQNWTDDTDEREVTTRPANNRDIQTDKICSDIAEFVSASYSARIEEQRLLGLKQCKSRLAERQKAANELLARLQHKLESAETRAESYLTLKEYLTDDHLIESTEYLHQELKNAIKKIPIHLLSSFSSEHARNLADRAGTLVGRLKESRGRFASKRLERLQSLAVTVLYEFKQWTAQSEKTELPKASVDKFETDIDTLQSSITEYLSAPYCSLVSKDAVHMLARYQNHLAEAERAFTEFITGRQNQLESLEERAVLYLEVKKYAPESNLFADVMATAAEIEAINNEALARFLPLPLYKQLQNIEIRFSALKDKLEDSGRRYSTKQFEHLKTHAKATLKMIDACLHPARNYGESISSPTSVRAIINDLLDKIDTQRNAQWAVYFGKDRLDVLIQFELRLNKHLEFIEEKIYFDDGIKTYLTRIEKLRDDAAPYTNYEKYLTEPVHDKLSSRINTFISALDTFSGNRQLKILASADRQQVQVLRNKAVELKTHLEEYNPEFVRRQRAEYANLFSNIGPKNHNLTKEQQKAVIRNGVYNQVVAAAGTGKTLTLTTRVAYLIHAQNVDPNQILVVTYTRKAKEEMQSRLAEHFGITHAEVQTVNAFGHSLISDAHGQQIDLANENEQLNFIDQQIREAKDMATSEFLSHYYEFLVHFEDIYYDKADFKMKKEYVQARATQDYVTLRGTEVKSRAEKLIADFLYTHQVPYRYEDRATWADTADDKAGYNPDFYLPAHDVYIEHWGIDESGSVAPWFSWSSQEYREKMLWARNQFTENDYGLIDTYEFEHDVGRLKEVLRHRLTHHGIELEQMDFEQLVESAFDYDHRESWIKDQLRSFIENAKQFELSTDDIKAQLSEQNPRQYHFAQCGIHLLEQYAAYLQDNMLIDYTDQIRDAVELIQSNPSKYQNRYQHVLVDEFQDIGAGKLELIQELTGPSVTNLFVVGDDWQSIYSFQGAAVQYFTQFEKYFGNSVRTSLTANYRSPQSVISAGNQLISQNTNQLEKTVRATLDVNTVPRVHALRGYDNRFYDYVRRVRRYSVELVQEYIAAGTDPSEIMILCRFDSAVSYLDEIRDALKSQEIPCVGKSDHPGDQSEDGVSVSTVHQAKGQEAERVIVLHAAEGPHGFPPNDRENELMNPVQPLGVGGVEEERRVFYVAVTRAKRSLDLLTRANEKSRFLDEIAEHTELVDTGKVEPLDDVGERMSVEVEARELNDPWRKQHQRGILADRYGGSVRFVSWMSDTPPTLKQGEWYYLSDMLVDEYKNEKELVISGDESVTHLPEGPQDPEVTGLSE